MSRTTYVRTWWPAHLLGALAETYFPLPVGLHTVVVHRPLTNIVPWVHEMHDAGVRVLIDEDDDLEAIPWEMGRNLPDFELLRHRDAALALADGLTCSTEELAGVLAGRAPRTWIVPNYLPAWIGNVTAPKMRRDTSVKVGWAGIVKTHRHDLEWLAPVASEMIRGAEFTTIGDPGTCGVLGIGGEVFPFTGDQDVLYQRMARADIGIVPLAPIRLNTSKSWLKALEYMTLGKPVVVADLPQQRRLVRHGVDGFLAGSPEEFRDRVQELVQSPELRARMGAAARERGRALALERQIGAWKDVLDGAENERSA